MLIQYDTEVGAFYIQLGETDVARTGHVSDDVRVDYDADGQVVGIELLVGPSHLTEQERADLTAIHPPALEVLAEVARLMPTAA